MARRFLGIICAFFFDDTGILDIVAGHGSACCGLQAIYNAMGATLDSDKSQPGGPARVYLGQMLDLRRFLGDGTEST